jgi:transcriptional regulator with XRE-family HTH domain
MHLGNRIKSLLDKAKISQKKLATDIGLPEKTIGRIIRGEVEPGVYKVKAVADYLNVDLTWLISGVRYRPELQEATEVWRISDGAEPGYNSLRSAKHIHIIMNACAMDKEAFARELQIPVSLLDKYLEKGIPESEIIYKMIKMAREHGEPVDLEWFVTGLENK